jgi:hypothetical protein
LSFYSTEYPRAHNPEAEEVFLAHATVVQPKARCTEFENKVFEDAKVPGAHGMGGIALNRI